MLLFALLDHLREPLHHGGVGVAEEAARARVERGDLPHLIVRKAEVEHVKVLRHAFAVDGLGNHHRATLQVPAKHHLSGGFAMRRADPGQHFVFEQAAAPKRVKAGGKLFTMMEVRRDASMTYQTLKFYCNQGLAPNV